MQEYFFIILLDKLTSRPDISEFHCIKDAKVPLMRFKLDGVSIDLQYAELKVNDCSRGELISSCQSL